MDIFDSSIESVIEKEFVYYANKYLDCESRLTPQYPVNTLCGDFRLDFIYEYEGGRKVAFECDGKEFHNESRDEWRDAMILGGDFVNRIFSYPRFRYKISHRRCVLPNFTYRTKNVYRTRSYKPKFISEQRSKKIINPLRFNILHIPYENRELHKITHLCLEYRSTPPNDKREFWQTAYSYALKLGGGKLDDVIKSFREKT